MATLAELVREHTALEGPVVAHLQRLVGTWGTLSDLCFADLLLFAPVADEATDGAPERFVVLGQVRPTTSQTLHLGDLVGQVMDVKERPLIGRAWRLGSVVEGEVAIPSRNEQGRLVCIPVRWQNELVAVLTRESALLVGRRPGELERVYVEVFDRLARMIAAGEFPFPIDDEVTSDTIRVGDGVLVLDATARVEFTSPNALNALHRIGLYSGIEGLRLEEAGLEQTAVGLSFSTKLPVTEEVDRGGDVAVVIQCVPLLEHGTLSGALVLLRDVSDLRRRDRLLLSKDAAIREVHHRVKNNLQTISSLLRLQSRRLPAGEARHALEESERRVRSIALVHEILSRDTTDQVDFNDILPSIVRMAEDLGSTERPVRITYRGEAGELQASLATPLAVVLTELLQNAAEHGFPEGVPTVGSAWTRPVGSFGGDPGPEAGWELAAEEAPLLVHVDLQRTEADLRVTVRDNGVGLPAGFSIDDTSSLGLSIVRGLVGSQMGGTIDMRTDNGTVVEMVVPVGGVPDDLESL